MRIFAIIILLSFFHCLSAQSDTTSLKLVSLVTQPFWNWENGILPGDRAETGKLLEQVPELHECIGELEEVYWKEFIHLIDLNSDGKKDLIFGPCLPYDQVRIYMAVENGFRKVWGWPGRIVSIDKKDGTTRIGIRKEACCCEYWTEVMLLEFTSQSVEPFKKLLLNVHSDVYSPLFPDPNIKAVLNRKSRYEPFSTDQLELRSSPELLDKEEEDPCTGEMLSGNLILKEKDEVEGLLLLENSDGWDLVVVRDHKENSLFWLGWVRI